MDRLKAVEGYSTAFFLSEFNILFCPVSKNV